MPAWSLRVSGVAIAVVVTGLVLMSGLTPAETSAVSAPPVARSLYPVATAGVDGAARSSTSGAAGVVWAEVPSATVSSSGWGIDSWHVTYDAAAGYLLAYGPTDAGDRGEMGYTACADTTWAYVGGHWTNLSVPGPTPARCASMLGYDPGDGSVVLYGGWYGNYVTLHDTWTFRDDAWTEADSLANPNIPGTLVSDPALGCALLFGGPTWEFCDGQWSELLSSGPTYDPDSSTLAFDDGTGCVLLLTEIPDGNSVANQTWEYCGVGNWTQLSTPPPDVLGDGALAWDPELQGVVLFGGVIAADSGSVAFANETWIFRSGQWTELPLPGPQPRIDAAMAFDPSAGGLVMSGGWLGTGDQGLGWANDTWVLAFPPEDLRITATASPTAICSQENPDCPAFATESRVSLMVTGVPANPANETGLGAPVGTAVYGPYEWVDLPSLAFVPYGSIDLASAPDPTETCATQAFAEAAPCSTNATLGAIGTRTTLTWAWATNESQPPLMMGDTWTMTFLVIATGPPFSTVPVDACITPGCLAAGSAEIDGSFSALEFTPDGNTTMDVDSAPLAMVQVVVLPPTSTPPSSAPPSAPPAGGSPLPAPSTPAPVSLPVPTHSTVLPSGAQPSSVSPTAVAGGILAIGVAGVFLRADPIRHRMAMRVGRIPGKTDRVRPPPTRGED